MSPYIYVNEQSNFSQWRKWAKYSLSECAEVFDVSRQTVTNWETGKIKPPRAVFICLQLFSGRLDFLGTDWKEFRICPNYIESPDGLYLRANEIRAAKYALDIDRIKAQKLGKIQTLKAEIQQDEKLVFFDVAKKNTEK